MPVEFRGGVPENVPRGGIERKPRRQGRPIGQGRRVGQRSRCRHPQKAPAGTWNVQGVSSATLWSAIGAATGASLTGVTVSVKVSERANEPSLAVTLRSIEPVEVLRRRAGEGARGRVEREPGRQRRAIPQRRRVGQAAVHIDEGARPAPGRSTRVSSAIDWLPIGVPATGASLTGVIVSLNVSEALSEPSLATHREIERVGRIQRRRPREGAGERIEREPWRQGRSVGQGRRVGQGCAVDIRERIGRHLERPGRVLRHALIGDRTQPPARR